MRAVVDTNAIAYYLLGTEPFADETRQFWRRIDEPLAPASWESELCNVLWMAVQHDVLSDTEAVRRLRLVSRLGIQSVSVRSLWEGALMRAIHSGVAAYDALFVELAVRESIPLATFDRELLDAFPDIAQRPAGIGGSA